MKKLDKIFSLFGILLLATGCEQSVIDTETKATRQEVRDSLLYNNKKSMNLTLPRRNTPPNISRLLVAPPPPPMGNGELISFAVTNEVPIKDVLIEIGRISGVDIEVDPAIQGGIILKVTNKPLNIIVQRIADLGNLRYSYSDNILRFEKDTPYTVTYNVDFLIENEVWNTIESSLNEIVVLTKTPQPIQTAEEQELGNVEFTVDDSKIIINKPASIITAHANKKTQNAIKKYIEHVKKNYASQVLIEAKVVEVTLNDEYKTGIDWSFIDASTTPGASSGSLEFGDITNLPDLSAGTLQGSITTAVFGGNLTAAINALETFGLTKTLSSPRVHAMNNQKSELKFISKLIYFNVEKEEEEDTDANETTTTFTSTKQEEEVGVTLTITPSINPRKNEITLSVVPELKIQIGEVVDPIEDKNIVPVIQSRSVNTSLKIKSGNVLVIGGLMSEEQTNEDTGVPFLSGIPVLGNLFRNTERVKNINETVIFIKATIVSPDGTINSYDKNVYDFVGNKDEYMWE